MKLISFLLLLTTSIHAATQDGVTMPDQFQIEGQTLTLNGQGTRKATWLKVKVYVGGLYLTKKSSDAESFLKDKNPKYLLMHFVRSVEAEKIKNGWREGFDNSTKQKSDLKESTSTQMNEFINLMQDVKKGDQMSFTFLKDKTLVKVKDSPIKEFQGAKFGEALLAIWFRNAEDEGLRDGLLGK